VCALRCRAQPAGCAAKCRNKQVCLENVVDPATLRRLFAEYTGKGVNAVAHLL
jgi:hypothetical protein